MKLLRSTPLFIKGILIAGMLSACQNENETALAPQAPTTESDRNARTAIAAGTLIKDGSADLAYFSQGSTLLWKEIYPSAYSEFIYAPQLITAKGYKYGNLSSEYKYTLDASGRCIQSFHSITNKTYIYEYNAYGQLTKWYNKDQPKELTTFSYSSNSASDWTKSLNTVTFYDAQSVKIKELTFAYGGAMATPDKHHLSPDVLPEGVSKYLPIFGTFNTNLIKMMTEIKYLSNGQQISSNTNSYNYTLDYAGRVKNITLKKLDGTLISSTDRKYSVPVYNF